MSCVTSTWSGPGLFGPTSLSSVRVALLGSGLIGGSIGLALRRTETASKITAYDHDPAAAIRAVERGAADQTADSPQSAVVDADLIFVSTPVLSIPQVIREASPGFKAGAIVTDVGSTKSRVVDEVYSFLPKSAIFIGGHPMAGTEHDGIEAAKAALFDGAWWILTPTPQVDPRSYQTLHSVLSAMGCQVLALEPALHDELMAIISHLPHLTAATLMNMAAEHGKDKASLLSLAAGGFRDVTRVAASNPTIWIDICRENRDAIVRALDEFAERLSDLRILIGGGDLDGLRGHLLQAREARRDLGGKKTPGELVEVFVPVPDRPGVLSDITTMAGNLAINIEDLQITHAEEGGRGVIRMLILGVDESRRLSIALEAKGYEPRATSI